MASNYNRKSASSGSRRGASGRGASGARGGAPRSTGRNGRASQVPRAYQPAPSSARPRQAGRGGASGYRPPSQTRLTSVRVGDLDRAERAVRAQHSYRRYVVRLAVAAVLVALLAGGGVALYWSNLFQIEHVTVSGVEHLTSKEMEQLAAVPAGTTLLRVDAAGIKARLLRDAWVKDASINRIFPDTLELAITERTIAATVMVPTDDAAGVKQWAIASDGMWLMPIPAQDSEAGKKTSPKVYEDAAAVLSITDVPYGTKPEIGAYCTDENVNNALAIVDGMTTGLADQVKVVSATGTETTTLTLDNGVQIAFGTAEDIRDKERVCLKLMEEHEGEISYINVRVVDRPTWRAL